MGPPVTVELVVMVPVDVALEVVGTFESPGCGKSSVLL